MKDNFSKQAEAYVKFRPTYPKELFDFIFFQVKSKRAVWDCGTGNGQTAKELSSGFDKVYATDISQKQIDKAYQAKNIFYSVQPAEQTNFPDNVFDLITVSQAIHWFQFDKFYSEANRVLKPSAWIAVWTYTLPSLSPDIDKVVQTDYYKTILGEYWDNERRYVDDQYATIPFPFKEIKTPQFKIELEWNLDALEGYLNTWSALQNFISANHINLVSEVMDRIRCLWTKEKMKVTFPIHLRMGQIQK